MKVFHGLIVENSLIEGTTCKDIFNVVREKRTRSWKIVLVEVGATDIIKKINELQRSMDEGTWYNHFYDKEDTLYIVFKEKSFKVSKSPETWSDVLNFGLSLGIPKEQLDFIPRKFDDENEYFGD